jgi:hypothetical protein
MNDTGYYIIYIGAFLIVFIAVMVKMRHTCPCAPGRFKTRYQRASQAAATTTGKSVFSMTGTRNIDDDSDSPEETEDGDPRNTRSDNYIELNLDDLTTPVAQAAASAQQENERVIPVTSNTNSDANAVLHYLDQDQDQDHE